MGATQSTKQNFFWPKKGEIQMWVYSQLKVLASQQQTVIENDQFLESQTQIVQYKLTWQFKAGTIQFTANRMENGVKLKFSVDPQTGNIFKYELNDQDNELNQAAQELCPSLMWKCWIEVWRGQQKCNSLILNKTDSLENASLDFDNKKMKNPTISVSRQRKDQVQILTRELKFTNSDDESQNKKYQINMQFIKTTVWIFNWDSSKEVNPEVYVSELNTESPSIYQNTAN